MKISYAITVCNELNEITRLLNFLIKAKRKEDEIVILFDKKKGTPEVWQRISELKGDNCCSYYAKTFKHHFADWKNKPEIKWKNKVHEVLEGHKTYALLPGFPSSI